jgi:hypothetical protein
MKKIAFATVAVLLVAWFFATPYLALWSLKRAAENQDVQTLSQYVDFPALKESLKSSLRSKMTAAIAKTHNDNPYGNIVGAGVAQLAVQTLDPVLDAIVTPETIAALLRGQRQESPSSNDGGNGEAASDNPLARVFPSTDKDTEISAHYANFDTFVITLKNGKTEEALISFLMKRQGIASWKIAGVMLPN